ncbi:MAG: hypothetical protein HQ579_01580 [Candidatus Omnitrophica bacterium]|nr:hypothetical protein [Candidatus Omnitrophota bacterium]
MRKLASSICLVILLLSLSGCTHTYPKETLADSIVEMCKKEYKVDIKAELIGNTLAIYIPLPSLFDITLRVNKESQTIIQNVILSASRVALSTNAKIEFYCVIAQDARMPEIQIIVIKYITDVKRAYFLDISRGEYFKRAIFDINVNPQSKKEKSIKEMIKKYEIDPAMQEKVIDEFFRSAPLGLKDFGYWQGRFYIKNITLPEFLAEQIAYRVRMKFREDDELSKIFLLKQIQGSYKKEADEKVFFYIYFDIKVNEILEIIGTKTEENEIFKNIFIEVADCLYGYKFKDFDAVKIYDQNNSSKLIVTKDQIYAFKRGRLKMDAILAGI